MKTVLLLSAFIFHLPFEMKDINLVLSEYLYHQDVFLKTFDRDYNILDQLSTVDTLIVYESIRMVNSKATYVFSCKEIVDGYTNTGCDGEYIRLGKKWYTGTLRKIEDIKKGNLVVDSIGSEKVLTFKNRRKNQSYSSFNNYSFFYVFYIRNKSVDSVQIIRNRSGQ